jgi:hypothetical protein
MGTTLGDALAVGKRIAELEAKAALVEELVAAAKEIPATLNRFLVTDPGDLTGCTQRGAYHQAIRDISMSTAVTNLEAALAKAEGAK